MRLRVFIKRILIYLALVLVAFLLQCCVFTAIPFLFATPNFLLIVTFSYGFIYGSTTGIICGIFSGFLMDTFNTIYLGVNILIYSTIGFMSGLFKTELKSDSMYFPLVLCFFSELIYTLAMTFYRYFLYGRLDLNYTFINIFLPEVFFSLLATLISYRIFLVSTRKLDDIDKVRGENAA